ncbi:probable synaptic vesicle transporter SVOP and related transporters (major facilitator superfamily) [Phialocephala subalpina]|uniref:Probable synaptic vesicle transporter SVOP and related transporters (Major facilitator superfamily) n=1 Tax=Phialocephala subalpina TaxID=576137 RepID=A0A1L7XER8_9HELO|nr:probable synaptic vesicle transporter SVOP and related transporters (major facilitator superfamily) [Phialocephala subalpina]
MATDTASDIGKVEEAQHLEQNELHPISHEHQQYILERHSTTALDPMPDMSDADPYNWPKQKKIVNLLLVAFHAMMATFTAAAIQSAFVEIAIDLHVSIQRASYLTSLVIAILGGAPLFWRPLSDRYGRRPIFLLSLISSLIANIGCAKSPSYATMALCRAISAFCISPAAALGSAVVSEAFLKSERAKYIGIWAVMVTIGVPSAPFIFGFVALRVGYRWIYWILANTNGCQFVLYFFFGAETRYIRGQLHGQHTSSTGANHRLLFRRIDPTPMAWWDFIQPLSLVAYPCVFIPAAAYAMTFLLANVLIAIEIPQLYVEKFHLNTQQVGLQNLSIVIGSLIGEQVGGVASDKWMSSRCRNQSSDGDTTVHPPEYRLWLSYSGFLLAICGMVVFLVRIGQATDSWNITPTIGAGLAAAGNQIVTTVLITYAVDCYPKQAGSIGVFMTFVRQIWGFIGPFDDYYAGALW